MKIVVGSFFLSAALIMSPNQSWGSTVLEGHRQLDRGKHSGFIFHTQVHNQDMELESGLEFSNASSVLERDLDVELAFDVIEESGAHEYHFGLSASVDFKEYQIDFSTELFSDFFTLNELEAMVDVVKRIHITKSYSLVSVLTILYAEKEVSPGVHFDIVKTL